jgi:hypothetical protein
MELDKDFSEFVALFIDHDVQFLIVGDMPWRPMDYLGQPETLMLGSRQAKAMPSRSLKH